MLYLSGIFMKNVKLKLTNLVKEGERLYRYWIQHHRYRYLCLFNLKAWLLYNRDVYWFLLCSLTRSTIASMIGQSKLWWWEDQALNTVLAREWGEIEARFFCPEILSLLCDEEHWGHLFKTEWIDDISTKCKEGFYVWESQCNLFSVVINTQTFVNLMGLVP